MDSQLVRVHDLTASDRAEMYHLLQQHFQGVRIDVFQTDLREKNWVILLRDGHQALKGFSTLLLYTTEFDGVPLSVVYSGDTIVDPSAWSSTVLARSWIDAVNWLKQGIATHRLYWLLISSGYRTYRFLPTFWREFYPRFDTPTPPSYQRLMDHLALERFGDRYDPVNGLVRLSHPHTLRGKLQGIPTERETDPHVQFFATRNPGHAQGDELVCLTEICEANLTRAGRRMWFADHSLVADPN
ncbi:MAG: hypothetical protein VKK04_06055 [Synechococcales bacterium]|nr:hypothetical protein [Synechococcales bacterium]